MNLRSYLKARFDNIKSVELKEFLLQSVPLWVASCVIGLVSALYAELVRYGEGVFLKFNHEYKWAVFILAPIFFFLSYFFVKKSAKYANGSGIPQVLASLNLPTKQSKKVVGKLLGLRVMVVKILSSFMIVLGGGVVGREGPTIQISSSILYLTNKVIPNSWPKIPEKLMYITGGAAGLAAAFNTPLGGIVFAIEELTKDNIRYLRTTVFAGVIIAGFTAQTFFGPYLVFGYPKLAVMDMKLFFLILLTSVIVGVLGTLFGKATYAINQFRKTLKPKQNWLWGFVAVMIFATIVYFTDNNSIGGGGEILDRILFSHDKSVKWYTVPARLINGLISFTNGGAGGIFAPCLSFGGLTGAQIAGYFSLNETEINLLAVIGMVGFLTSFTRSPFTSAVLVLEMTDRHSVIFQLMLAAIVAYSVGYLIDKHSYYEKTSEDIMAYFKNQADKKEKSYSKTD